MAARQMNPAIQNANLDFTTHCDRRCPDCCCGIGIHRVLEHHPWEYFERAASILYGIPRVNLTGGEPTFHPQFAEFVPKMKALFGCEKLTMITDGWGVQRYAEIIKRHIDWIEFSDYHRDDHRAALHGLQGFVPVSTFDAGPGGINFVPRSRRGFGAACNRAVWRGGTVAYADGKLYGCCVAPGIEGAIPVEPTLGWDARILTSELPCKDCFFSE